MSNDEKSDEPLTPIKVVSVCVDDKGLRVVLENACGETSVVNIPNNYCWGDRPIYWLDLVFDHSGKGDHYE